MSLLSQCEYKQTHLEAAFMWGSPTRGAGWNCPAATDAPGPCVTVPAPKVYVLALQVAVHGHVAHNLQRLSFSVDVEIEALLLCCIDSHQKTTGFDMLGIVLSSCGYFSFHWLLQWHTCSRPITVMFAFIGYFSGIPALGQSLLRQLHSDGAVPASLDACSPPSWTLCAPLSQWHHHTHNRMPACMEILFQPLSNGFKITSVCLYSSANMTSI